MLFLLYAAITLNWLIFFLNPWSWSRRVLWISLSVLLSESYLGIGSFYSFFGNQHGLREPCGVVYHRAGFFENKIFAPENGDNRPSLRFFKCIGKFTYYFFLNAVYNESLCYLLYSYTIWYNSVSWDMDQNALDQLGHRIFKSTMSLE